MSYQLEGQVKLVNPIQTFSSGFSKRELIVSVKDGNYVQDICIEFVKDKAEMLEALTAGQKIAVKFDIKGREYNGKYFNNLQGWYIEKLDDQSRREEPDFEFPKDSPVGDSIDFDDPPF